MEDEKAESKVRRAPMTKEGLPEIELSQGTVVSLDCYPYTFSPLLLFVKDGYFDKGYSNYNAVAQFFRTTLEKKGVDMLSNVLFDRRNMLFEELLDHVTKNEMLVVCCIDNHFTGFKILSAKKRTLVYYDPLSPYLLYVGKDSFDTFVLFHLLKCKYADSSHIQENKDYYTDYTKSNAVRREIYRLWKKINDMSFRFLQVRKKRIKMDFDRYFLINGRNNPQEMSTQLTGNTCYFQTFLFAVLFKVCDPKPDKSASFLEMSNDSLLREVTIDMSKFLLEFFIQESIMRPLTNNNVLVDFHRYKQATYYEAITHYLDHCEQDIPNYQEQYDTLLRYFESRVLHLYDKFSQSGEMSSTINTKQLQFVTGIEDARYKLGSFNYYKYRPATMMFGFHAGIMKQFYHFHQFNSLRKNQLLAYYTKLKPLIEDPFQNKKWQNKYRDYYFLPQFEVGQPELVNLHHYTYALDLYSLDRKAAAKELTACVLAVNEALVDQTLFSTSRSDDYDKYYELSAFKRSKFYTFYKSWFMTFNFFDQFAALAFPDINPKEKEKNSLTQVSQGQTRI